MRLSFAQKRVSMHLKLVSGEPSQSCLLLLFIFGMACQRQTMDSVFMGDLFCELAFSAKLNSSELPRSMNSDGMVAGLWLRNQSQEIN